MEKVHQVQPWWRFRLLNFKNATIVVCLLNLATALFLLQGFLFGTSPQPNSGPSFLLPPSFQVIGFFYMKFFCDVELNLSFVMGLWFVSDLKRANPELSLYCNLGFSVINGKCFYDSIYRLWYDTSWRK